MSSNVNSLVNGSGLAVQDRGTHVLKDVLGEWKLFAAVAAATQRNC